METGTYQQNLVLDQRNKLFDTALAANRAVEDKANVILQAGGVIIALVAAFGIADLSGLVSVAGSGISPLYSRLAIIVAFVCFLITILLFQRTLSPRPYHLPGKTDWDEVFSDYLEIEPSDCFEKILSDLLDSIESIRSLNEHKSAHVVWMGRLLLIQVLALATAVVLG